MITHNYKIPYLVSGLNIRKRKLKRIDYVGVRTSAYRAHVILVESDDAAILKLTHDRAVLTEYSAFLDAIHTLRTCSLSCTLDKFRVTCLLSSSLGQIESVMSMARTINAQEIT